MIGRRSLLIPLVALPATLFAVVRLQGQTAPPSPTVTPYHASGNYRAGETVGWRIVMPEGSAPVTFSYTVKRNNAEPVKTGTVTLSGGNAAVEVPGDRPEMLYMELTSSAGGRPMAFGAAVDPMKLKPVTERPKDFDAFWKRKIDELHAVPENPAITPGDSYKPEVQYATIRMDHVNGTHVYGQIAQPRKPGKYPAVLILQWASPPYPLQKPWVIEPASQGWLALNIEPHDVLPTEGPDYYQGLPDYLKNYAQTGQTDREKSAFVEMYLRDYRAVDYLAKNPNWDGKTLLVMGTSMGGQQSFAVAGLHPKITHLIVNVPAGCDLNASLHGRQMGYPFFNANDPKVMETARYVDCINFASHIKATSLVAMGYVDTISPPAGVWTAFNLIKGRKEAAPMVDSPHNNLATPEQQRPYTDRSADWMNALVRGEKIPAPLTPDQRAEIGVPRNDRNSQIAHSDLLAKARKGGIDLYFVGDSITRRWGTSDVAYANFLENWKQNFFGWNAGDFGWGGDSTANILWRLQNGELDGMNPRAIVVLAGTNDVGTQPASQAKIDEISRRLAAIVRVCRRKAPKATIVLTAIFPRNDNPAAVPSIEAINRNLAALADGRKVRFLNVNDRLADARGQLYEGMTVDGLHPSVKGYQIWADGLKPILLEILGPPAKTDHAPPPTGDPSVIRN